MLMHENRVLEPLVSRDLGENEEPQSYLPGIFREDVLCPLLACNICTCRFSDIQSPQYV